MKTPPDKAHPDADAMRAHLKALNLSFSRVERPAVLGSQFQVEPVGALFAFESNQILYLALAGQAHPFGGGDFAGHHVLGVLACGGGVT